MPLLQTFLGLFEQRQLPAVKGKNNTLHELFAFQVAACMDSKLYIKHNHLLFFPIPDMQSSDILLFCSAVIHRASSQCVQGEDLCIQATSSGSVGMCLLEEQFLRIQTLLKHHHLQI